MTVAETAEESGLMGGADRSAENVIRMRGCAAQIGRRQQGDSWQEVADLSTYNVNLPC